MAGEKKGGQLANALRVHANPYQHVDPTFGPQAVVAVEGTREQWVGARLNLAAMSKNRGKHVFDFDTDANGVLKPQTVPVTSYYIRAVWAGDLVVADLESARKCGLVDEEFKEALAFLAAAEKSAAATWDAQATPAGKPGRDASPCPIKLRTILEVDAAEAKTEPPAPSPAPTPRRAAAATRSE